MILPLFAHLVAFFVGVFASGLLMVALLPLSPGLRRVKPLYPIVIGVVATMVGACSVIISRFILGWFGVTPGWPILVMLAIGWLQNDLRRVFGASEQLAVLAEWNQLVGHQLGIAMAATLSGRWSN